MPKVNLGKPNYESAFGAKLKASLVEKRLRCDIVASKIGFTPRTLSKRFNYPSQMTLGQLKLFIKVTNLSKEDVINYLYEGR